jgi:excisionase family DNA binding protein
MKGIKREMSKMIEPLLSIPETSEILGISRWTATLYVRTGRIAKIKIGRRILIEPAAVRDFIARCRANTAPARVQVGPSAVLYCAPGTRRHEGM